MKKTIGILAHVDAGKTTLSERLLYYTGSIRNLGRVDYRTSFLDTNEAEKNRGITIFAGQADFVYKGDTYYLIDTPGHADFSAETERSVAALDYAILLIGGSSGVQAHTMALFRLLESNRIPTFIFINKTDAEGFSLEHVLSEIDNKLTHDILPFNSAGLPEALLFEFLADRDDEFLKAYMEDACTEDMVRLCIIKLVKEFRCFPVISGSALKGEGIDRLLELLSDLSETNYEALESDTAFSGKVYKIRHDDNGNRLTFIKALNGKLKVKDEFLFEQDGEAYKEKVNEIRIYNGQKFEYKNTASAGDVFAVTGLRTPVCGTVLESGKTGYRPSDGSYFNTALQSRIKIPDGTNTAVLMEKLRMLEAEDPMLSISFQEESGEILLNIMGNIQLEVLTEEIAARFGITAEFEKPKVLYKETITAPVVGYGHFEPLRHYAEVQLRLEPLERGSGIRYKSECPVDDLARNYQNLIGTHVFERSHKGVLTGSAIADIRVVLQKGRAHIKHTEGGDFREATYRAIRQGLEKAASVVLEPFYQFDIYAEESYVGRVMADIQKMKGTFDPPEALNHIVHVHGRGPVASFMDYSTELVSFTKGTGSISFRFDGYDLCQNPEEVIESIAYDKERDTENTSWSVFCAKGTSFTVPWNEAEHYMHTIG